MKKGTLICCLFSSLIAAADNETMQLGVRAAALGNAGICLKDGWSAAHNPAGLGFVQNLSMGACYENRFFLKELSTKGAFLALPIKAGTFGFSLSNFGYSLYQQNSYRLSFGKAFTPAFSMGLSLDYLDTRIGEAYGNKTGVVATLGIHAKPLKNIVIAVHVYNPSRNTWFKKTNDRIPTIMKAGLGGYFSSKVLVLLETEKELTQKPILKAGIEYKPLDNFYLRMGVSNNPTLSTFGIGCMLKNLQLDLAVAYHQTLGVSPQIGFTYIAHKYKTNGLDTE